MPRKPRPLMEGQVEFLRLLKNTSHGFSSIGHVPPHPTRLIGDPSCHFPDDAFTLLDITGLQRRKLVTPWKHGICWITDVGKTLLPTLPPPIVYTYPKSEDEDA